MAGDFGELMGFSQDDFVSLLHNVGEGLRDDEVTKATNDPLTVPGNLSALRKNRLMPSDATNINQVEKLFENQLFDMWLTEPLYIVIYEGKTADALVIKND